MSMVKLVSDEVNQLTTVPILAGIAGVTADRVDVTIRRLAIQPTALAGRVRVFHPADGMDVLIALKRPGRRA